jgi:hypothetical protein
MKKLIPWNKPIRARCCECNKVKVVWPRNDLEHLELCKQCWSQRDKIDKIVKLYYYEPEDCYLKYFYKNGKKKKGAPDYV